MKVFLSGPMTGYPDFNHAEFNNVARVWRAAGHEVYNPAEAFGGRTDLPRATYMRWCLKHLLQAEAIISLSGWQYSAGAKLERQIAQELGLAIRDGFLTSPDVFPLPGATEGDGPSKEQEETVKAAVVLDPQSTSPSVKSRILEEATSVVYSERSKAYGLPEDNFDTISQYWTVFLDSKLRDGDEITAADVALMLILMKVGRVTTGVYKHDTAVDLAGYAECYARVNEVERE